MTKTDLTHESLIFLKTLYETQNLVNAAGQLGLPPATASRMLARLRSSLGDELFTRCSSGLTPTWRTRELMPQVRRILEEYDRLLVTNRFDPRTLKRSFRIAGVDHGVLFLAPAVARISGTAPGVSIEMTELDNDWPVLLRTGELDAVISPVESVPEGFHYHTLREGCSVMHVCRPGHPVLERVAERGFVTEAELLEYGFVEVTWHPTNYFRQSKSRESPSYAARRIVMRTPYFIGAAKVAASSDLILQTSTLLGEWCVKSGFLVRIPLEGERDGEACGMNAFEPKLIWHERSHHDPAMQWLRGIMLSVMKEE